MNKSVKLAAAFAVAGALLLGGCGVSDTRDDIGFDASKDISYSVDQRTGLCYAFSSKKITMAHGQTLALANVPCTPQVNALAGQAP